MTKMVRYGIVLTLSTLVGSTPLQAADDMGLILPNTGIGHRGTGVGVTAGIRIKLGPDSVVRPSERVKLGIAAGPVLVLPDPKAANGLKRNEASLVSFDLRPGYSTSLNLAGRPVAADYTLLGAAEDEEQSTGDKVAWVAAVAGVVAVVAIGGLYLAIDANSE